MGNLITKSPTNSVVTPVDNNEVKKDYVCPKCAEYFAERKKAILQEETNFENISII